MRYCGIINSSISIESEAEELLIGLKNISSRISWFCNKKISYLCLWLAAS